MKRRKFLGVVGLGGLTLAAHAANVPIFHGGEAKSEAARARKPSFTLWQLASQVDTIGNSYVLLTRKGRVVVMDGGVADEASYLRGFLGALGNNVAAWFVSHPHADHMGALREILKKPGDVKVERIYHSRFSESLIDAEPQCAADAREFYALLDKGNIPVTDMREPGLTLNLDGMRLKVLGVTNEEFRTNPYNNSSTVIRVDDGVKSVVFLADAGVECGNKLLTGPYASELNCDYMQMAHHGQQGCDENFYRTVEFSACLWPTPLWVWNNDSGKGINTAHLKTFDTRAWMDAKGIREHHVSCLEGLWRLG